LVTLPTNFKVARFDSDQRTAILRRIRLQLSNKIVYTIKMKIVWDEPKRQANIVMHGLDLAGRGIIRLGDRHCGPGPCRQRPPPAISGHRLVGQ